MKVLDNTWINTVGGTVGIVLCENDYGQKAFACVVDGLDGDLDIKKTCEYGSTLTLSQAQGFFGSKVDTDKFGNY